MRLTASRLSLQFMILYMHTQVGCVRPPCCFYTCAIKLCCWISFVPIGVVAAETEPTSSKKRQEKLHLQKERDGLDIGHNRS